MRATFEADSGAKFVFYRQHCDELVRVVEPSGKETMFSLEEFVKVIRKIQRQRHLVLGADK